MNDDNASQATMRTAELMRRFNGVFQDHDPAPLPSWWARIA
ncbi:MAG: hypothetical protein ACREQX_07705 [Candidatus Binataceae bacterium]